MTFSACVCLLFSAHRGTWVLQDHSCVKIPKDMDFSVIDKDPPHIVKGFEAKQLQGTWYKVRFCFFIARNIHA